MKRRFYSLLLLTIGILLTNSQGQQIENSPLLLRASQGVTSSGQPTYFSLTGFNGLELDLSLPSQRVFDYTVMFWFRSALSKQDLVRDRNSKHHLFELDGSVQCFIKDGVNLDCNPPASNSTIIVKPATNTTFASTNSTTASNSTKQLNTTTTTARNPILLEKIPDIEQWMHLTYTAHATENYSTLRIDYPGGSLDTVLGYASISSSTAHLGIDSGLTYGFKGDVREFYMSFGAIKSDKIPNLMNVVKVYDISTMAYYRFQADNGVLNDWMRNQKATPVVAAKLLKQSTDQTSKDEAALYIKPTIQTESATNPFCNTLESQFANVAKFETFNTGRVPVVNAVLDQDKTFTYTLSMWVHNLGARKYSANARYGVEQSSFFTLEGAFSLWFDSPTSFRVYVYAKDNINTRSSPSTFLPLNQWVNIQVNINSSDGITIMTFNTNGERQQVVTRPGQLAMQVPVPYFNAFTNFNGYILDLILWQGTQINIPYQTAQVPLGVADLISIATMHYNFNQTNYDGSGFRSLSPQKDNTVSTVSNPFATPTLSNQPLLIALLNSGWRFDTVLVPIPSQVNFKTPSTLGQLSATNNLFDGIGCPEPPKSQFLLQGAPASVLMPVLYPRTNQFTVEFWFRLPKDQVDAPKPNYLFTMGLKQKETTNEAMTIYIDNDGLLKCAPFGLGGAKESILVYEGVYPYEINSWQHVSCVYDRDSTVTGQHLAYNPDQLAGLDSTKAISRLLSKTFAVSLADQDQRILNYIQATTIIVILGSNAQTTQAQNCYFKDLRVWVTKRSAYQLFNNRFKQVSQSPDLIVNFKLMDGNPTIKNDADSNAMKATLVGGQYTAADGQNIVCAVDKYFVPSAGKCTTFPFSPNIPIVYSVENSVQHGHTMLLTSNYAMSPLTLPNQFQPSFQNYWSSPDKQIDALLSSHRSASIIEFDPNYMVDGKKFQYTMLATDPVNHNWWQRITDTIQPRKCFFVVDKNTDQPFNQINYNRRQIQKEPEKAVTNAINAAEGAAIIKSTQDPVDLCFAFQVKQVDGCSQNYFDVLSNKVSIQTQPKIPTSILTKAVTGFDPVKKDFNVCFNQETLNSADYPVNVPINFIFYTTWTKSGTSESSNMQIVYQVRVNEPIMANLTASTPIVDVDQSVLFDARSSKFAESGKTEGLMYRWQCPVLFQTYCDDWLGSPVLEFSPAAFLQLGGKIQNPYVFIVQTWSLQSGDQPQPGQVFSAAASVMWKTLQAPKFGIVVTSAPDPSAPILFVTKPNQILIQLLNYRGTDSNLRYTWDLKPADQYTPDLVKLSADKSVMIIAANALKFKTTYTLTVDIKNDQPAGLTSSQTVTLSTQSGPTAGSFSVTPTEGKMLETDFKLQLSGFATSNPPLSFSLWGITSTEPTRRISLSAGLKTLDTSGSASVTLNLPFILGLEVEVTDGIGEFVKVRSDVKVTQATSTNYTSVVQNINKLSDESTKLQYTQYVAYQVGQDAAVNKTSTADARTANRQILALITNSTAQLSKTTASEESMSSMKIIASAVQQLTSSNQALDEDLLDDSLTLLEEMMANQVVFQPLVASNQEFNQNYATALANLISYSTNSGQQRLNELLKAESQSSKKRLLNAQISDPVLEEIRSQIHRVIVQKNRYLDSMCKALTFNGQEIRLNTPKLELVVSMVEIGQGYGLKDKQFVHTYDQTTVFVPVDEIIRHTLDLDNSVTDFCVQVSFMQNYPLSGYNFIGQYPGGKIFAQTSSLDNKGNRILSSQDGITGLELKPYSIKFPFDFASTADFQRNQTVCMSFNNNLEVLGSTRWQQNNCRTEIKSDVKKGERTTLTCFCNTMSNHYIGLITDKGRDIEIIIPHRFSYEIRLLAVFIPLALLGLCCPCFVMRWDRNDTDALERDPYEEIDDTFIDRFRQFRGIECREEVLYKLPQLHSYEGLKDADFRVGTCTTLLLYFKALHPLYSLYFHFDFFNKRLLRLSFVIWQVCWITIFALACFLKNTENTPVFLQLGDLKLYVIGFLFGLMTLPPPGWVFEFFKIHVAKTKPPVKTNNVNESKDAEDEDEAQEVVLNDSYMYLKMIFLLATGIVYLGTLTILLLFIWYSRTDLSTMENLTLAGYLQFFKMTDQQVINFIAAWYLAVPGFGWILINGVRIFLIAQLAPVESRTLYEEKISGKEDGQTEVQPYGLWCCLCKLLSCIWCIITFPFVCCLRCLKWSLTCCHTRCSFCCNCSGLLYLLDYTWRTLIFIPKESVEMGLDVLFTIRLRKPGGAENVSQYRTNPMKLKKQMEEKATPNAKKYDDQIYDEEGGYDQEYSNQDANMAGRESSPDILEVATKPDKSEKKKKKQKKNKKKKSKRRAKDDSDEDQG